MSESVHPLLVLQSRPSPRNVRFPARKLAAVLPHAGQFLPLARLVERSVERLVQSMKRPETQREHFGLGCHSCNHASETANVAFPRSLEYHPKRHDGRVNLGRSCTGCRSRLGLEQRGVESCCGCW